MAAWSSHAAPAGVTNAFLISTHDPLARVYNDSSVLENNHVCSLYTLLSKQPAVNIFRGMGLTAWKECRWAAQCCRGKVPVWLHTSSGAELHAACSPQATGVSHALSSSVHRAASQAAALHRGGGQEAHNMLHRMALQGCIYW